MLRSVLLAGLLATALATPAFAGSKYTTVSQSFIVLKGIPARTRRKVVEPAPAVVQAATVASGAMLTAEERRLLRYGVAEEQGNIAAEAKREIAEEDAASTMTEAPEPEEVSEAEQAEEAEMDDDEVAATEKAEARRSAEQQARQEQPEVPQEALDQLGDAAAG